MPNGRVVPVEGGFEAAGWSRKQTVGGAVYYGKPLSPETERALKDMPTPTLRTVMLFGVAALALIVIVSPSVRARIRDFLDRLA